MKSIHKVNLREELEKSREDSIQEVGRIVESSKLLLTANEQEERNVLANLGLDKNLQELETVKGINLERGRFESSYETKVFTLEEIKEIACEYGLRFLHSSYFRGALDTNVAREISRFGKINGLDITQGKNGQSGDSAKFMMLAPEKEFTLINREKPARAVPIPKDPALFYEVSDNKFALVHQWGNDFSIMRLVNSWRKRNSKNKVIHRQLVFTGVAAIVLASFGVIGMLPLLGFGVLIGSLANLVFTSAQHAHMSSRSGQDTDTNGNVGNFSYYTEDIWNQPYNN
jgi:hypothetical protein|tara:strand:+ start:2528 stop:3385 length:858 start_codon:yes stop_codon:yes gene_type:complete